MSVTCPSPFNSETQTSDLHTSTTISDITWSPKTLARMDVPELGG